MARSGLAASTAALESPAFPGKRVDAAMIVQAAVTILGGFVLGYLIDAGWARLVRGVHLERRNYKKFIVGRFRIHHNVLGYVLLLCGFLTYPLFLVPLGLGVIVGHRIRDRLFWFVEVME